MKILSAQQIREADAYTIELEPIKSIDLMERAANACVDWFATSLPDERNFKIFCGLGNNGGDGLAIARLLSDKKYSVEVFIVRYSEKCSKDFKTNEELLLKLKNLTL